MIDEQDEELATMYVFGALEGEELRLFEARLSSEPALVAVVDEFRETAAKLALAAPTRALPPDLEGRILDEIRAGEIRLPHAAKPSPSWLPWTIAACLALAAGWLVLDRARLHQQVATFESRDTLSRITIANLSSQLESSPKATAVVVWDSQKQEGVLRLLDVPPAGREQDYQLWVVDPQYGQPVDAGVFDVDTTGATRISFKPKSPVRSINGFAVSLERKGGVPKAEGPMVLVGK